MNEHPPIDEADVAVRQDALLDRLESVLARIDVAAGGGAAGANVALLPVSKGHPVEAAIAAARLRWPELGENYAQELAAKARVLVTDGSPVSWHFIGQLQTNKVRMIAEYVTTWQSVDRLKVGKEIAKRAPGARIFAQVNLSSEAQKAGCSFDELDSLVDELRHLDLNVDGLMGVGTADNDVKTAAAFGRLRAACDRLGLTECSMGMTADLELAIREGSTMVRVGSDLFGPRPAP